MAWVTEDEIKEAVADILSMKVPELGPKWDRKVAAALASATADIYQGLRGRGVPTSSVDSWDRLHEISRKQALYWALTEAALPDDYDLKQLNALDMREKLPLLDVYIGGVLYQPSTGASVGGSYGGQMDSDNWRFDMDKEW